MHKSRSVERDLDLRRFSPDRPPVVVLGGLNLTRAAGVGGLPVIVASADQDSPVFASRFCSGTVHLPPLQQPAAAIESVLRLGERLSAALGKSVPLLYGDDNYLSLVLRNRGRLAQYYRFIVNDAEVAESLMDKERFDAFARARKLPVPRTLEWGELEAVPGPILVKPKVKVGFADSQVYLRLFGPAAKARVFARPQEVLAHPLARSLRDKLLFQEYIAGDDRQIWSFHGFADERSRVLAWFTGRKIRTCPGLIGTSTYLQLAKNDELARLGLGIVAQLPLKGVFKIDFKQDPRSGRFLMLEVDARFNLWHYLGAVNGVNVPLVAYDYLMYGETPVVAPRARASHRWLSLRLDYRAYRYLAARGELSLVRWIASLGRSRKVYDVFAWADPLPLLRYWMRRVHRVPGAIARVTRWLFTAS
jgi:predicted ATP-grasp superfamily ATP-dependent carboligase